MINFIHWIDIFLKQKQVLVTMEYSNVVKFQSFQQAFNLSMYKSTPHSLNITQGRGTELARWGMCNVLTWDCA